MKEKSGVEGVGATDSIQQIPNGRMTFRSAFPLGPENVESVIKYALKQVETIKSGEILEEYLNKIKESYLINYKESLNKDSYWLS